MVPRSTARWLAPLALMAAVAAVGLIVTSSTGGDGDPAPGSNSSQQQERDRTSTGSTTAAETTETSAAEGPASYTVKSGDTLADIAEETGVTVQELQELNPDVDPQSLT